MSADVPRRPRSVGSDDALFKCPICKKPLPNENVPTFPFCSDRCRLVDLGNWLDGKYQVSRSVDPTSHEDDASGPRTSRLGKDPVEGDDGAGGGEASKN
jgi:endogenous inhibitor of DNA gyrase (YacG/DUF329 family)